MNDHLAECALFPAIILAECFKSNVGDHPWVRANPAIAIAVEKAILAMEEACEAISQKQSEDPRGAVSEQGLSVSTNH